ncbi:MAG: glycosyltransferase [bacterium]|nr:glycosyltransferase [bacterium]
MRVVQLSTMRDYYGGEVCLANLARGLGARGHDVTCVVRPDSRLAGELPARGLATCELPLFDWYEPVSVSRLAAWLRRERIDIVHAHTPRDWFIATAATVGLPTVSIATRHLLLPVAHARVKRSFLRRLGAMIAVSDAVRQVASGLVADDRLVTVPNGVELPVHAADGTLLRSSLGLGRDDLVIGCVARLSPEKGVDDLLRAVARLQRRWPNLVVLVMGDAPADSRHPAELQRLALELGLARQVRFCGYQPDAATLCAAFDVQVVSSLAEPCGLATLEAMAQSRPVVVTDSGGSPELVADGCEGFLVPPGRPRTAGDPPGLPARFARAAPRNGPPGPIARGAGFRGRAHGRTDRIGLSGRPGARRRLTWRRPARPLKAISHESGADGPICWREAGPRYRFAAHFRCRAAALELVGAGPGPARAWPSGRAPTGPERPVPARWPRRTPGRGGDPTSCLPTPANSSGRMTSPSASPAIPATACS